MLKQIFNKILGKSKQQENSGETLVNKLSNKSEKVASFLGEKVDEAKNEFFSIKSKLKDLRQTNYDLGLKHLENGNLSDAIFRFRFIIKFWPDLFDAHFQLAYCLVLNKKPVEAKKVLENLLNKKPDYDPKARELLNHINSGAEQPVSNV